jgi:hypothetical protein
MTDPTPTTADLLTRLASLESAMVKAASGQVARIREGEKWIEYHAGDTAELRRLITETKDQLASLGVMLSGARGRARRPVYLG